MKKLTSFHAFRLQANFLGLLVFLCKPLTRSHGRRPRDLSGWEQIVLEQLCLQSGHCEAKRLHRIGSQTQALGKLDNRHVALIFGQKAQALVQRGAPMM